MSAPSLLTLYQRTSKHSNYQVLSTALAPLLNNDDISVRSRHEHERLAYILARLPAAGRHMADIGGNTGFFAFELLAHGARRVDYYEGNAAHHDFVQAAAARVGQAGRLHTHHRYVTFEPAELPPVDCTVLLNVLHHLGDDFGDPVSAKDVAKQRMLECLRSVARSSHRLVLQLGFNWKGDRHQPLFERGSKSELIDFIEQGTAQDWDIEAVGIAERVPGDDGARIVYCDRSDSNIARDDSLGEFLNRPIFIMRSRHAVAGHGAATRLDQ